MLSDYRLPQRRIVLLGVGHTNAHVLRMWARRPIHDAELVCVSDFSRATYSGMLPGALAGQYLTSEMEIDLVRLCALAGARLITDPVTGLDPDHSRLLFAERPPMRFDALSIGVGSRPLPSPAEPSVVAIKPMQTFLERLETAFARLPPATHDRPWKLTVVGAGAGGVEIALCLPEYVRRRFGPVRFELQIVSRDDRLMAGASVKAVGLVRAELERRGVELRLGVGVVDADDYGTLLLENKTTLPSDLTIWAVSARPREVADRFPLPFDAHGFFAVRPTLQSTNYDQIFAVGDASTCLEQPRPKAGVYAVRQGPILWENFQRMLASEPLVDWKAQDGFLALLNTGDGRAVVDYKGFAWHGAWCWKLKRWIDGRFMRMYQPGAFAGMTAAPTPTSVDDEMACGGCGCKIPHRVLTRALHDLGIDGAGMGPYQHVMTGVAEADDVAVWLQDANAPIAANVDFFTLPLDDPFVAGKLAARNSLSALEARNCRQNAALAMAETP
ncbi:MAG: FAD-dependent oxidoreductase, partial [Planctomycetales bacterium]|nr:FAD-dependent oxidoreductase [Planctomycetales bacterium]